MKFNEEDVALRIYLSEAERLGKKVLFEEIVLKAREMKMAGATVYRGIMGFGAESHIHTLRFMDLSTNLPIIIEIVDKEDKIGLFLPYLDEVLKDGFVTMEKVKAIRYKKN